MDKVVYSCVVDVRWFDVAYMQVNDCPEHRAQGLLPSHFTLRRWHSLLPTVSNDYTD